MCRVAEAGRGPPNATRTAASKAKRRGSMATIMCGNHEKTGGESLGTRAYFFLNRFPTSGDT